MTSINDISSCYICDIHECKTQLPPNYMKLQNTHGKQNYIVDRKIFESAQRKRLHYDRWRKIKLQCQWFDLGQDCHKLWKKKHTLCDWINLDWFKRNKFLSLRRLNSLVCMLRVTYGHPLLNQSHGLKIIFIAKDIVVMQRWFLANL